MSENGNGLPNWAKLISTLGFPIVVAMLLLGMLTGYVSSPITRSEAMLEKHIAGEWERTRLIRVMCRHQSIALKQNPDECD